MFLLVCRRGVHEHVAVLARVREVALCGGPREGSRQAMRGRRIGGMRCGGCNDRVGYVLSGADFSCSDSMILSFSAQYRLV